MTQLQQLAQPFPDGYVQQLSHKGNADYIPHHVITQRLLEVLGPFSFEVVQVVDLEHVLCRLSVEVDGRAVSVTEAGQSENPQDPFKSAVSDGLKRCAMRLGCGLHVWAGDRYYLARSLAGGQ